MADDDSDADASADSGGGAMSMIQEHRKVIGVAVFLVVVVAAAGVLYMQGAFSDFQAPTTGQDTGGDQTGDGTGTTGDQNDSFNTYASADEDSASTDTSDATFMGTVEIQQYGTSPARIEGKVGEAVRFDNTNSFPVTVTFDRSKAELSIPANSEDSAKFRAITQYTVTNADTGDKLGSGTIYVE